MNYSAFNAEWAVYAQAEPSPQPDPESGYPIAPPQPRWLSRQAEKMFTAFRTGLATLGAHLKQAPEIALLDRDQGTN